jgi:hypothetical protein
MSYIPFVGPIAQWLLNLSLKLKDAYGMVKSTVESVQKVGPAVEQMQSAMKVQGADIAKAQVQAPTAKPMVGGGATPTGSSILIVAIGAIIVASFSKTFWSVYNSWNNGRKVASNDDQRNGEISDEPPQPDDSGANASGQTPRAGDA